MEEARVVLARLERIETLDREQADQRLVLAELRELVREVEAWVRCEKLEVERVVVGVGRSRTETMSV